MFSLDLLFENKGPLGAPDKIVEIDEMKFGKQKYQKDALLKKLGFLGQFRRTLESSV